MFRIVEKNQKLVKGIMIVVIATFVMWGIGSYLGMGADDGYVAKVGGSKIYLNDIDNAMQQNPENKDKMQVLFGLINRQLLLNNFISYNMVATDMQLQQEIGRIALFQEEGRFNINKYQSFLKQRYMSAKQFQDNVSGQIMINQIANFFKTQYFTANLVNQQFAKLLSRERIVSSYIIKLDQFYDKININEKDINNYYQQNIAKYTIPQQAKFQYIEISKDSIAKKIQLTDKQIDYYISNHRDSLYSTQVDVSHILFTVAPDAAVSTKNTVKAKALKVLAEVRANPNNFAQFASRYSQDTVSAQKGGELGFFGKGVMVKPFENVAFSLKVGQISGLVETQFGYHILKLNAIRTNNDKTVRDMAVSQLKQQNATFALQKQLEKLNDITYKQSSSLEPAARAFGVPIQISNWIQQGESFGVFANPKIQQAIFTSDVLKSKNNSEVVDLGNNIYAVYHLESYRPSDRQPLAIVRAQIVNQLKKQQASVLVYKLGQQNITALQQNKLQLNFANSQNISLLGQGNGISSMAVKQIFGVGIASLPAYTGSIDESGNYVIYKINGEIVDSKLDKQSITVIKQLEQENALLDFAAYITYLRSKYPVTYKMDRLNQQ